MKLVIQRVRKASVEIEGQLFSSIQRGLMILVGITENDGDREIEYLCKKVAALRIFDDEEGVMNRSVMDVEGEVLMVSQFTLMANTKKGNRPSYIKAAKGAISEPLYDRFCSLMEQTLGKSIARGKFGADMQVSLINDGPVTIVIDTEENI
ncbi:D-aminoacyl-tRNA deacylase [Porphyromonas circumdentaria]|uniref:D-aminoacyl-tRNA deacylase n=1 Tax=Porphyromonas circumdentaria TaxID=29524 RepID=A0A1T4PA74_9PORP|nr:D-aminoacyl-tRNA deacylase [Porphyromonas circumdentaria]MBB6276347.1 D-tyrosyl-tRNA(Tyr) deacylase [Porphyromonas circumdentaria]MDO4722352.1 D-aminoacyl-tRNA deacylase [Porphyromonas circumdentaria]SJZ88359.1 D-tyrosyl-tRNA(Tyr) deacylase [Porphyromonas circumdentaria]